MHPIVIQLGDFPVTSYGLALAIAFAVGTVVAMRRASENELDPERVLEVAIVVLVSALVGARFFYVLLNPEEFASMGWAERFLPMKGDGAYAGVVGLSVMGGLPTSLASAYVFLRLRGGSWWPIMDIGAPSVALGAGITRIGCFLNGCCHGRVCDWPWAVRFPDDGVSAMVLPGAAVHPTQLYAAAAGFAIFFGMTELARRRPPPGVVLSSLCIAMGLQRFAIEPFRYNRAGEIWADIGGFEITVYQLVAVGLIVLGSLLVIRAFAMSSAPPSTPSESRS